MYNEFDGLVTGFDEDCRPAAKRLLALLGALEERDLHEAHRLLHEVYVVIPKEPKDETKASPICPAAEDALRRIQDQYYIPRETYKFKTVK